MKGKTGMEEYSGSKDDERFIIIREFLKQTTKDYIFSAKEHDEFIKSMAALKDVQDELYATDKLLESRQKVLDAIPECPEHGACVPHALEWIEQQKEK
jgi:hypothetical protein